MIRIIREEDEPKQVMMARWSLTDNQAEAILNMRLRALRKLEEFEIRKEFDGLSAEKTQIEALLASNAKQWKTIRWEVVGAAQEVRPATPSSASAAPPSPTRPSTTTPTSITPWSRRSRSPSSSRKRAGCAP